MLSDFAHGKSKYGIPEMRFSLDGKKELRLQALHHPMPSERQKKLDVRTMVDCWFAYRAGIEGLVKSTLSEQWLNRKDLTHARVRSALLSPDPFVREILYISTKAMPVIKGDHEEKLVKDHVVPVAVLEKEIPALADKTPSGIDEYLLTRYRLCIITKDDEDKRLNDAKLKKRMPENCLPTDNFARYNHPEVNIQFAKI